MLRAWTSPLLLLLLPACGLDTAGLSDGLTSEASSTDTTAALTNADASTDTTTSLTSAGSSTDTTAALTSGGSSTDIIPAPTSTSESSTTSTTSSTGLDETSSTGEPCGTPEICDGLDNDCDEKIDEIPECGDCREFIDGASIYDLCRKHITQHQAREACQSYRSDMDLVVYQDQAEQDRIFMEIVAAQEPEIGWWFGLTDEATEGVFVWIDETPLDKNKSDWSPGEPNNQGGEDCAYHAAGYSGHWHDVPCNGVVKAGYICEGPL